MPPQFASTLRWTLSLVACSSLLVASGFAQAPELPARVEDDEPMFESDRSDPTEGPALTAPEPEAEPSAPPLDVDARLEKLDDYLARAQSATRRYTYSWLLLQTGLTAGQAYVASTWDSNVVRGSYWIGTALSGTSLLLQLLAPKPALNGHSKFRKMPDSTPEEKQAKVEAGEQILAGQAKQDLKATSVVQHMTGVIAALGSGLGVGLGWDNSLKQAITRSVGVFFFAELQIITRPRTTIELMDAYSNASSVQMAVLPMLERDAQGLMLAGTF